MTALIGGVGYLYLRDGSLGPHAAAQLARETWPAGVLVEDLSYGPIAVIQRLQEADPPLQKLILVGAVRRGRPAGTMQVGRWDRALPGEDEIQARVAEAVTGVISLDNVLILAAFFEALPEEVLVVEVEPEDEGWGDGFSAPVAAAWPSVLAAIRRLVGDSAPVPALP